MKRRNTQTIGEVLRDFFEDNTELYEKILDVRIQRAWRETLGPTINYYTRSLFVRDHILYVSLTSSVLRSEARVPLPAAFRRVWASSQLRDMTACALSSSGGEAAFISDEMTLFKYSSKGKMFIAVRCPPSSISLNAPRNF